MKAFDVLALRVGADWRRAGRNLTAFPGIATRALEDFDYALTKPQLDEALAQRLLQKEIPDQVNLHNTFGQPPLTLFNDGRFVVDLYFWLTFDTSIHSHGFRGAFRVLHGQSLHEVFEVTTTKAVAPDVALVRVGRPKAELLKTGDVRPIRPGRDLTHRVVHLENPTVTLCVKTINEPRIAQWKYFPGGLAIQMRRVEPGLIKRVYYFQYLLEQDPTQASAFLDGVLRGLDRSTCMNLYGAVADGAIDLSEQAALQFSAQVRGIHGDSEWFRRTEPAETEPDELHFETCSAPLGRLIAHLVNSGADAATAHSLLGGHSKADLEAALTALLEVDGLFGLDLSLEDRAAVRSLLLKPGRKIPMHLRSIGQVWKLGAFLKLLGR